MLRRVIALLVYMLVCPIHLWAAALNCNDPNAVEVYHASPSDPETIAYTTPAGSDQILFVGIGQRVGGSLRTHTQTHAGNALTAVTTEQYTDPAGAQLFYIVNPTAGTNNVVVDWNAAPLADGIIIFTCSNANTASPIRSFSAATGSGTAVGSTPSTVQLGDVVVDFFFKDNPANPSSFGANQTVIKQSNDGAESAAGASWKDGANGSAMTWTIPSEQWAHMAAVVKPLVAPSARRPGRPMVFE